MQTRSIRGSREPVWVSASLNNNQADPWLFRRDHRHRPALRIDNHFAVVFGSRRTTRPTYHALPPRPLHPRPGRYHWARLFRAASCRLDSSVSFAAPTNILACANMSESRWCLRFRISARFVMVAIGLLLLRDGAAPCRLTSAPTAAPCSYAATSRVARTEIQMCTTPLPHWQASRRSE
jgi:hypothetical protein